MGILDKLAFWRQRNEVSGDVKPPNPERSFESVWFGTEAQYLSGDSDDGESFMRHGVLVTPDIAFQAGVVWGCIDVQAKAIASSEWQVVEQISEKKRRVLYDDNLYYLLNTRPNMDMTGSALRRAMSIALLSWGNAYAEITWNRANRVESIYPIHPNRVHAIRPEPNAPLIFRVTNDDGSMAYVHEENMFRLRGPSIVGMLGLNRISQAAGAIALSMATDEFSQAFFSNGGRPGGIVKVPGKLDDSTYERLAKQWNLKHGGPRKAFKTAFLDNGMDYKELPNDGSKSQMNESRREDALSVCRYWGIPPHLVQIMQQSTLNNIEHQGLEFVRNCLRPIAREFNQEGDHKLFSDRGPKRRLYIDLDWMSEGDFKSRMEGLNIGRDDGVLNANEIREEIGFDNMGPDGDKYVVQGAMIELKDVGLPYKNQAAAVASKQAEPAEPDDDEEDDVEEPDTAMARAWARSVYSSSVKFKRARLKDLQKNINKSMAEEMVSRELSAHVAAQAGDFIVNMSAMSGRDATDDIVACCRLAVAHGDVETAVDTLFRKLKS